MIERPGRPFVCVRARVCVSARQQLVKTLSAERAHCSPPFRVELRSSSWRLCYFAHPLSSGGGGRLRCSSSKVTNGPEVPRRADANPCFLTSAPSFQWSSTFQIYFGTIRLERAESPARDLK